MPRTLPRDAFVLALVGMMIPILIAIELFRPHDDGEMGQDPGKR